MTDTPSPDGPPAASPLREGTDVQADPDDLEPDERPATSDPAEFTDDQALGGVGGESPGGAG